MNNEEHDSESKEAGESDGNGIVPIDIMKQMQLIRARFRLLAVQLGRSHFSFQQMMQESLQTLNSVTTNNGGMSAIDEETPDSKASNTFGTSHCPLPLKSSRPREEQSKKKKTHAHP